ncbi:hypothetical protein HGM15179_018015 [Zosterops borbonicus]|uniref:Uncharacterized protein n=1 Tax=Zosterops borbonicus TaxID=364589 RepID=A0A8K1LCS3_9PASS|nr:hypothetical protein HGM15179_018015 [Zosterops borbonicus]
MTPQSHGGSIREPVIHDCLETIETTYSSHLDLKDTPIEDAETWFTDRSSYVVSGKRHAGYAVTISREVIESGPLPTNTSAQKAEHLLKIKEQKAWIHHSRVKKAPEGIWKITLGDDELKLKLTWNHE